MQAKKTIVIINPFAQPSSWFPEPHQILQYPNESRANAAWLGLVAPIVMLPGRLWNEVLRVALRGHLIAAVRHLVVAIPSTSARWVWWGITGKAYAVQATPAQLDGARFLAPHESIIASINDFPQVAEVTAH